MDRFFRFISAAAVIVMMTAGACSAGPRADAASGGDTATATDTTPFPLKAAVDTLEVSTSHIASPAKCVVAVPSSLMSSWGSDSTDYPVVYLLHGYDGTYADWSKAVDLAALADRYGFIIVCPDGRDSWYWDSPVDSCMQMESYMIDDLVPYIDEILPTAECAITGLSMGGHGAMWLAMRHPSVFSAAGSMSGGLDLAKFPGKWGTSKVLGRYDGDLAIWRDHSVMSLLPSLKPGELDIIFDCGEGDFFYRVNCAMDSALTARGIPHTFTHRPGNHSWRYWVESLPAHLDFFKASIDGNAKTH